MLAQVAFWVSFGLVVYIYVGYPAAALLLSCILRRDVRKADIEPTVTVVIAAFNEQRDIEQTVLNKLAQLYPGDRLDVIVVSDGSTDGTDAIVKRLAERNPGRVRLLRQEPRQGKTQALNAAALSATAEILVFSDANSIYAPDGIRHLVHNFADPSVGYVTGRMVYTNPDGAGFGEGSGAYMRYENYLRALETRLGSIVGVDGGIDAIRRELYVPMRADQLPDFVLPLQVVERGRRVVYEPRAILQEQALAVPEDEFRMRVRVSLRALWALVDRRGLLNPFRYPLFAWQLLTHKVLRYVAFLLFVALLISNMLLVSAGPTYRAFLLVQCLAYGAAAWGHGARRSPRVTSPMLVPYYFVLLNAACAVACWRFVKGRKIVTWTPRGGA